MAQPDAPLRTELPDAAASRAVLVGVSDYLRMDRLPAVANNLGALRDAFTDPELWGLDDRHCIVLQNPDTVDEVLDTVHAAARDATDALVVYFAGHGLLDDKSELYLALPGSESGRLHKAVRYDDVRREVMSTARRCRGKVVILDCCYSGRAMLGGMGGAVDVADHARIDGTYLMTASAETSIALAPPDERYTAFSGALINTLTGGLPGGPDLIGMDKLYWQARADLESRRFPVPQQRTRNDGNEIALARNRWGKASHASAPVRPAILVEAPAGFEAVILRPPSELINQVEGLRESDREAAAEQLLAAAAFRRADQEVAALVELLRRRGLSANADLVIRNAARRGSDDVVDIVAAMRATELSRDADDLIQAAAAGPVEDVAAIAAVLRSREHRPDLVLLLDGALAAADGSEAMIALVGALTLAGLADEVSDLLGRATTSLSDADAVSLADNLRTAGRDQAAFRLYASALPVVATRAPDVVAQLSAAMRNADHTQESDQLVIAAVHHRHDPQSILELAEALWGVQHADSATLALERAAAILADPEISVLADLLRGQGHDAAAFELYADAAGQRPAASTASYVAALREAGRPIDAHKLLASVGQHLPIPELVALIADFARDCAEADTARVIRSVVARGPVYTAGILRALLDLDDRRDLDPLFSTIVHQPTEQLVELVSTLKQQESSAGVDLLLTAVRDRCDAVEIAGLVLALQPEPTSAESKQLALLAIAAGDPARAAVVAALHEADPQYGGNPIESLVDRRSMAQVATLLIALRSGGLDADAEALLAKPLLYENDPADLATATHRLRAASNDRDADYLLVVALRRSSIVEMCELLRCLHDRRQVADTDRVLAWIPQISLAGGVRNLARMLNGSGLAEYGARLVGNAARPVPDVPPPPASGETRTPTPMAVRPRLVAPQPTPTRVSVAAATPLPRTAPTLAPPAPAPSAGDIISRVIFGGFWAVVSATAILGGLGSLFSGHAKGLLVILVGGLLGAYARYIFRGGRFRFIVF